jgi:polyisoprenyl-phosphate glycosyltransferase
MGYRLYIIIARIFGIIDIEGWTALMVALLFVSSFQMIALGIIGEYVWRGLDASRKRPLYIVEQKF